MLDDQARGLCEDFLNTVPCTAFAFAYGSAAFSQTSATTKNGDSSPMLDVIIFVNDVTEWHSENIELNRDHYGPIASLGASSVQRIAAHFGTGLHFNPFVRFGNQSLKYGVISVGDALWDLHSWKHMYLAGRMHKPIDIISDTSVCKCIQQAIVSNRTAAVTAAVLLQRDSHFNLHQLLSTIVRLSYTGDVRMGLAEDSNKVDNIVSGSFQQLENIYSTDTLSNKHLQHLTQTKDTAAARDAGELYQMPALDTQRQWVASLPSEPSVEHTCLHSTHNICASAVRLVCFHEISWLQRSFSRSLGQKKHATRSFSQAALLEAAARRSISTSWQHTTSSLRSAREACSMCNNRGVEQMVCNQDLSADIRQTVAEQLCAIGPPSLWLPGAFAALVARSSRRQALAGLLTTSPGKSLAYVGAKLQKRFRTFF